MAQEGKTIIPPSPTELTGNAAFATNVGLLFLRLALGGTFIFHSLQLANETSNCLPPPANLPTHQWIEWIIVGIPLMLVMLGLLTRLATLPIIATLVMTIVETIPLTPLDLQCPPPMPIYNLHNINLIAMLLMILLAGPGLISVDAFLFRRGLWARGPQPLGEAACKHAG